LNKKKTIISRSYGKLILAGEHAVVYGKPAIIFPINRFCEVKIISGVGNGLDRSLQIKNKTKDDRGIVKYVVNNFFKEFKIQNPPNLQIEINSNIPLGRGFGSSAAVITALVKSLYLFFVGVDLPVDPQPLLDFCISCENLIHKKSSGADIYACWFGKPIYFQNADGKIKYQIIDFNCSVKSRLPASGGTVPTGYVLIDTGKPEESTGEMVSKIRNSKFEIRNKIEQNINEIGKQTKLTYKKLITTTPPWSNIFTDVSIHQNIDKIENCLEQIGAVSDEVRSFIKDLKKQKISAKICGAGGSSKGSGVVMALNKKTDLLKKICGAYNYDILNIKLQSL
jgi:mevalonate kinase